MRVPRWTVWGLLGLGAVAAGMHWGGQRPEAVALPDAERSGPQAEAPPASLLGKFAGSPVQRQSLDGHGQLFAGRDWAPARKPAATERRQARATPAMPPFPYKYAGWSKQGPRGKPTIYLSKGGELVDVDAGEVLDGAWKIHSVSEERIDVTFLASGEQLAVQVSAPLRQEAPGAVQTARGLATPSIPAPVAGGGGRQPPPSEGPVAAPVPIALAAGAPVILRQPESPDAQSGRTPIAGAIDGPSPVPGGRLGSEVPVSGSMPTGPAPSGSDPSIGPAAEASGTPQGRLGE